MPAWHCRLAALSLKDAQPCDGPQHSECGLRYTKGEFSVDSHGNLRLCDVPGTIPMGGQVPRDPSSVTVWQDTEGWNAEFAEGTP